MIRIQYGYGNSQHLKGDTTLPSAFCYYSIYALSKPFVGIPEFRGGVRQGVLGIQFVIFFALLVSDPFLRISKYISGCFLSFERWEGG